MDSIQNRINETALMIDQIIIFLPTQNFSLKFVLLYLKLEPLHVQLFQAKEVFLFTYLTT